MVTLDLLQYKTHLKIRSNQDRTQVFDPVRRKWVASTPEEIVRQLFITYCIATGRCTARRISVERELQIHQMRRRYDLVLFDNSGLPKLLAECKAPSVDLDQATMDQAARYNIVMQVPYIVLTNGRQTWCCVLDFAREDYAFIQEIPAV